MKNKLAVSAMLACITFAIGCNKSETPTQQTESVAPEVVVKDAVAAYVYLSPPFVSPCVSGAIFLILELYTPYKGMLRLSSGPLRVAYDSLLR